MEASKQKAVVQAVLKRSGRTFGEELGIDVKRNTPAPLFQLLVFSILSSARIGHGAALSAARALERAGWTTPRKMAGTTWRQRTNTLNRSGYARYDESTSRMLGDTAQLLLEEYGGDLRKLRERAGRDVKEERRLLKQFKGIGDVGANIFLREAQAAWGEAAPFLDQRAAKAAGRLGLPRDPARLAGLLRQKREFPRLVAGLVRVELENGYDEVREAAA